MSQFNGRKKQQTQITIVRIILALILLGIVFFVVRGIVRKRHIVPPAVYADMLEPILSSKAKLIKKVIELQTTIHGYDARLTRAKVLEKENEALKKELGRISGTVGIVAHVQTVPNRSFYDSFIIDAGSLEGVTEGATVYAFDSIALGTITRVSERSSVVTLFSEPDRQTTGNVLSSDLAITLVGRGGGEYEVRMPRDVSFVVGDLIVSQSTTPTVLAEIKKVMTDPRDPFQKLLAKTPVNFTALKWVVVR